MKTRRSLRLENEEKSMQSILFPEVKDRTRRSIVPETPESWNSLPKNVSILAGPSVLETPDGDQSKEVLGSNSLREADNCNSSMQVEVDNTDVYSLPDVDNAYENYLNKYFDDSAMLDDIHHINLSKRKGIMSILESEFSFAKALKNKTDKQSSMFSVNNQKNIPMRRRSRRKTLVETVLPFDLNNEEVMSKKLAVINELNNKSKCKALQADSLISRNSGSYDSNIVTSKKSPASCYERQKSFLKEKDTDMSIDTSILSNSVVLKSTNRKSKHFAKNCRKSRTTRKSSFDSSDLDLTDANCNNSILMHDHQFPSRTNNFPILNFSTTDDEENIPNGKKSNANGPAIGDGSVFRNFSTQSCREYDEFLQNKNRPCNYKSPSPISNYNRKILEGELSPVNKAIFQLHNASLLPTQPASVLVLQGVAALVEVRCGAENRSSVFKEVLLSLGAIVSDKFSQEITHIIFRDGSKQTYKKAVQRGVHLVSPLWVEACRVKQVRVSESLFPVSSEYSKKTASLLSEKVVLPRKMKSMQPRDLEEDAQVVEARLKRRKKLNSNMSDHLCETLSTPQQLLGQNLSAENLDSPLFAVAHLLTPSRESASSASPEMSSDEKEFTTPLAARMYNRLVSPNPSHVQAPVRKLPYPSSPLVQVIPVAHEEDLSAPSGENDNGTRTQSAEKLCAKEPHKFRRTSLRIKNARSSNADSDSSKTHDCLRSSKSVEANIKNKEFSKNALAEDLSANGGERSRLLAESKEETENLETRCSANEGADSATRNLKNEVERESSDENENKLPRGVRKRKSDELENKNLEKSGNEFETKLRTAKPRKSMLKSATSKTRRTQLSVTYNDSSTFGTSTTNGYSRLRTERGKPISIQTTNEPLEKEPVSNIRKGLSSSLPSSSQVLVRRHRLHTVELPNLSQELITPSTPPLLDRVPLSVPYDELPSPRILSQREEMKRLTKKRNGIPGVLPLPRNRKNKTSPDQPKTGKQTPSSEHITSQSGKDRNPETSEISHRSKRNGIRSSEMQSRNVVRSQSLPVSQDDANVLSLSVCGTRRFSLLPQARNSLEEFQSPFRRKKKRSEFGKQLSPLQPSICVTSFHSSNIQSIYAIIKSLGGFYVTPDVDENTTHVVCGSERRTINVLHGISRGCWILDVSWIYESVELLSWAPEEPFELFNFCPGAKVSRLLRIDKPDVFKPSLFKEFGRFYVCDSSSPPTHVVQDILTNCGAHICTTVRSADIIIGFQKLLTEAGIPQVNLKWVFDSIQHWQVPEMENYLM